MWPCKSVSVYGNRCCPLFRGSSSNVESQNLATTVSQTTVTIEKSVNTSQGLTFFLGTTTPTDDGGDYEALSDQGAENPVELVNRDTVGEQHSTKVTISRIGKPKKITSVYGIDPIPAQKKKQNQRTKPVPQKTKRPSPVTQPSLNEDENLMSPIDIQGSGIQYGTFPSTKPRPLISPKSKSMNSYSNFPESIQTKSAKIVEKEDYSESFDNFRDEHENFPQPASFSENQQLTVTKKPIKTNTNDEYNEEMWIRENEEENGIQQEPPRTQRPENGSENITRLELSLDETLNRDETQRSPKKPFAEFEDIGDEDAYRYDEQCR